jgi:hypothetical protein
VKKTKQDSSTEKNILLLQEIGKHSPVSVEEVLHILSGKGQSLILLFLCLPFCQPLQIPGLSTPFGIAIAFIGLKMALGKYVWLPKAILKRTITPETLQKITASILWMLKKLKSWVYPRLSWLCNYPLFQIINSTVIVIMGICLALPVPLPFSNLIAAWSILLFGLGLLEDDGLFILFGYLASSITLIYFISAAFYFITFTF